MTRPATLVLLALITLASHHALATPPPPPAPQVWTQAEVDALLPTDGEIYGWTENAGAFGVCTHTCTSRNEGYALACLTAERPASPTVSPSALAPIDGLEGYWADEGFIKAAPTSADPLAIAGVTYQLLTSMDEDSAECRWKLEVTPAKGAPFIAGQGSDECMQEVEPELLVSPGQDQLAIVISYHGDHGCGEVEGHLWTLPIVQPVIAPSPAEAACYNRLRDASGHARLTAPPITGFDDDELKRQALAHISTALGPGCDVAAMPFLTSPARHASCTRHELNEGPASGTPYDGLTFCSFPLSSKFGAFTVTSQAKQNNIDVTYWPPAPVIAPAPPTDP